MDHLRRRFRFSLRTLLLSVTILGACMGWLGVQIQWIRDRNEARAWLALQMGLESLRRGHTSSSCLDPYIQDSFAWDDHPAPWSLRLLGELGARSVHVPAVDPAEACDARLSRMQHLCPEAEVCVVGITSPWNRYPLPTWWPKGEDVQDVPVVGSDDPIAANSAHSRPAD